ncbi:PREDICTED: gamma-tubulin complex component 4-like, partial [Vollenhovia emeryi]|uniref:gamma-tubulin complex component 4-like n=1 Tax=Vollenhovia emeryi TaxID=411798 RepID=UPI0005F4CE10
MLHEILLSLWGCSTSVSQIIQTDSVDLDKYLHPGERALLGRILDIVKECNVVRDFIHAVSSEDAKECVAPGLYIRALCDGMDQALEPFREEIIELENTVLNDRYTPLSLILCSVEKYTCLFSVLNSIIREVIIRFSKKEILYRLVFAP